MAASLVFRLHDRGPELVREVLLERGWEEYNEGEREEEDWNLYWRGSLFQTSQYHNLLPWQRLNHHPKTVGITRKVHVYIDFFFSTSCFGMTDILPEKETVHLNLIPTSRNVNDSRTTKLSS